MNVKVVIFPETKVAAIEHKGPPWLEHDTARKLVAWKVENRLMDQSKHRSYGVHYTDPQKTGPADHRVDFCLSITEDVPPNAYGIVTKVIPGGRCALARHIGSRSNIMTAADLYEKWFPQSGESLRDFPIFFHYVNVGPNVREVEMITDVYLPLK
jgi:AraC family transcriptional regulator